MLRVKRHEENHVDAFACKPQDEHIVISEEPSQTGFLPDDGQL